MSWFLAPSLRALFVEVDEVAPRRNRRSDGSIGDSAHQTRKSDHNPDRGSGGIVRAVDVTHDPDGGCDCNRLASAIRRRRDPRIAYVIFDRRIMAGERGPSPWVWRRYTGESPHTHHMHVSIRHTPAAETECGAWLALQEDISIADDATKEYLDRQFAQVLGRVDRAVQRVGGRSNAVYNNDNKNFQGLVMPEEVLAEAKAAREAAARVTIELAAIKARLGLH